MQIRIALVALVLFLAVSHRLHGGTVTYEFFGAVAFNGVRGPIVNGTPVNGSFTLDLTAAGQPTVNPQSTDYPQPLPPADLSLTVGGLTLKANSFNVNVTVGSPQDLRLDATGKWLAAPGWTYIPDAGAVTENIINFNALANMFSDLAHLPDLQQFPLPISGKAIFLSFGAGSYTYPDGSFTVPQNDETHFSMTSLARVPEPSGLWLAALAFAGFGALGWRRRKMLGPS